MRTRTAGQYSGHWLEVVEPEIADFVSKWPGDVIIPRAAVADLVAYAAQPDVWFSDRLAGHSGKCFAQVFRQAPDFVLGLMAEARKHIHAQDKQSRILYWLGTNAAGRDSFGQQKLQLDLTAQEIASAIGKTVSAENVRNANTALLKRLRAPRRSWFVSRAQLEKLTPEQRQKFSAKLPPVIL